MNEDIHFETERLLVRNLLPTDVESMFELDSDAEVHRYLGGNPVKTREEIVAVIQFIRKQYIDHGIGRWAMIEKSSGEFLGWTGLKYMTETVNNHVHHYDLGYRLLRKHWGKGYASESAKACAEYAFKTLGLDAVYAFVDTGNHASIRILEKTGLRQMETFDYEGQPHLWMRMLKP